MFTALGVWAYIAKIIGSFKFIVTGLVFVKNKFIRIFVKDEQGNSHSIDLDLDENDEPSVPKTMLSEEALFGGNESPDGEGLDDPAPVLG